MERLLGTFEGDTEEIEGFALQRGGTGDEVEGLSARQARGEAVFGNGGEVVEQGAEAVDGGAVIGVLGASLFLSSGRGRCRGDAGGALGRSGVMVVEEQGGEASTHVPFEVVGEHAQQDVGADPVGRIVMNGAHLEVDGFEATEGALDPAPSRSHNSPNSI